MADEATASFIPPGPILHQAPTEVAAGTYVIHEVQHALGEPLSVYLNSLVIQAAEPVIVDTGTVRNRTAWLRDVFSLVEPAEVRWVFLSHDDHDHTGNLAQVMAACPNATLVCSWVITERFANAFGFPFERCRWIDDGESFSAGDRNLVALRPPLYDSPATRGLFDDSTGVYWAADAFPTPVPGGAGASAVPTDVAELDAEFWWNGMKMFTYHAVSPWLRLVDRERFARTVDRIQEYRPHVIASGHSPVITGERVDQAFALAHRLPDEEPPPAPDQNVLEQIIAASAHDPTPAIAGDPA
jgi:flavorubredoxin